MAGNISILICSALVLGIIAIYLSKRWLDLDIIDLYIIFVGFHFGVYPFIRGLYFGSDVIFDFRNSNPLVICLVFLQVIIVLTIIRLASFYLLKKYNNYLKLRQLIVSWQDINKYVLGFIVLCLILFPFFSYYEYGVRTYIRPNVFAKIGAQLPYWFTSVRTIYNVLAFCTFIGLCSQIMNSQKYQRYLWILLTVIFVPIVTIFGRRYFVNMIVIATIFWFAYKEKYIFQLRYLGVGLGLLCTFFLFSNVFEAYRNILQKVGQVNTRKNILSAVTNMESTLSNLRARPGTWEFDFLVLDHQFNSSGMTTDGKVAWEAFKSAVPRMVWPHKQFVVVDQILSKLYKVNPKQIDIGKNLYGIVQVDFGYYSFLIVPTIILFIIYLMAGLMELSKEYPTFLWLFSGNIIFFLVNVEENGNEIFFMLRNIIIVLGLMGLYVLAHKLCLKVLDKPREDLLNL
jgi:hypothetical protein